MKKLLALAISLWSCVCFADAPSRSPYDYKTCSSTKSYCANVSEHGGITVFMAGDAANKQPMYVIAGWYPQVFISNDGRKVVTIGTTILPHKNFDQAVLRVFVDGKQSKEMLAREILKDHKIRETTSGYHWGEPLGFVRGDSLFSVELDDGATVNISLDTSKNLTPPAL